VQREGERRVVTALFVDAVGSTSLGESLDEEEVFALMQGCVERMTDAVQDHGGTVTQFLGDGVVALFGAPVASEDSARHAVAAALDMQRRLSDHVAKVGSGRGIACEFRCGLNTGPVVVGRISDRLEMSFTALGDTVNLASRIQTLAEPGSVYLTRSTFGLVADYFDCVEVGMREVKGRSKPVDVYQAIRPKAVSSRLEAATARGLTPLVGRTEELDKLRSSWQKALQGQGQAVLVSGEAGIGKSRLLLELRSSMGPTITWLTGVCGPLTQAAAYTPIIELVKEAIGITDTDDEPTILDRVTTAAADWSEKGRTAVPYLKVLLSVDPGDPAIAEMDPIERRAGIFEAFQSLVQETARRPFVMAVEDLHWVDETSDELLGSLVDAIESTSVLVLLTHRPGYKPAYQDRTHVDRFALGQLSADGTEVLASRVAGVGDLPQVVLDLIAAKGEGNPFYVEEVTKSLLESGVLRRTDGACELAAPVEKLEVPATIQEVILARIDRLQPAAREALQLASVVGREFTKVLLERISSAGAELNPVLSQLKGLELIYEMRHLPDLAYMFKHALTHEVAYSTLLLQRRRELHALIGLAVEELFGDRLVEQYETLAHHFVEAEDWPRAAGYLQKAGDKAVAAYANQDSLDFYARALQVLATQGNQGEAQIPAIAMSRGMVNITIGDWTAARDDFDNMNAASVGRQPFYESLSLALRGTCELFLHLYDTSEATLMSALELTGGGGLDDVGLLATAQLVNVYNVTGRHAQGRDYKRRADKLLESAGMPLFKSWHRWSVGVFTGWTGDFNGAVAIAQQARRDAEASHSMSMVLFSAWVEAMERVGRGDYQEAFDILRQNLMTCERVGEVQARARMMNTLGYCYGELENHDHALEWNAESVAYAGRPNVVNSGELETYSRLNLAESLVALGRLDEAEEHFGVLEERSRNPGPEDVWMQWRWSQHLFAGCAEMWLVRDDAERALDYAMRCLALAEPSDSKKYIAKARRLISQVNLTRGQPNDAARELEIALTVARQIGNPAQLWKTLRVQSEVAEALGNSEEAKHARARAMSLILDVAKKLADNEVRETFLHSAYVSTLRTTTS
jgi:class 3 adenylate cyclase/tetratricopeptide (TPR) repeat protein